MDITQSIVGNFLHPPILFFVLGMLAIILKSDLNIPPSVAKFLSLYLLFHIGIKGGEELFHSGFSNNIIIILGVCGLISFLTPFICYKILRFKLDIYNAAAIAATYGSISAVNFINSAAYLDEHNIHYGGFMVASMALMESPAVISGLLIIGLALKEKTQDSTKPQMSLSKIVHEALFS